MISNGNASLYIILQASFICSSVIANFVAGGAIAFVVVVFVAGFLFLFLLSDGGGGGSSGESLKAKFGRVTCIGGAVDELVGAHVGGATRRACYAALRCVVVIPRWLCIRLMFHTVVIFSYGHLLTFIVLFW